MVRQSLCQVLDVICERDPSLGALGQLVASLNAWDPQRVDQPDYSRRLDIHRKINAALSGDSCTNDWILLVVYNCYYAVRMVSFVLALSQNVERLAWEESSVSKVDNKLMHF